MFACVYIFVSEYMYTHIHISVLLFTVDFFNQSVGMVVSSGWLFPPAFSHSLCFS